jgi:hypothetical protein
LDVALLFFVAMTAEAVLREQRLDLFRVVDWRRVLRTLGIMLHGTASREGDGRYDGGD